MPRGTVSFVSSRGHVTSNLKSPKSPDKIHADKLTSRRFICGRKKPRSDKDGIPLGAGVAGKD